MARKGNTQADPVGTLVVDAVADRASQDAEFRAELERLAQFEAIARFVIYRRAELGLSQKELAARIGTSHSAVSRIESGQHPTSVNTLKRLAEALETRLVVGFEHGPPDALERELIHV